MIKSLVMLIALVVSGLAIAQEVEENGPSPYYNYHENVGIPLALEIYEAEMEMMPDGTNVDSRVAGGIPSALGDCPYLGGLLIKTRLPNASVCGSSLVRNTWSVTAAHCWFDGTLPGLEITLVHGSLTIFFGGVRTTTKDIQIHEDWKPDRDYTNDIAVIKHDNIETTDFIELVNLPTSAMTDIDFTGMTAFICGYGRKSYRDKGPTPWGQVQSKAEVHFINNTECEKAKFGSYVRNTNICTQGAAGGAIGQCPGDSGSGIIAAVNGTKYVVGVFSFLHSVNCSEVLPRTHTRVTSYLSWLENKMGGLPPIDPR